MLFRLYIQKVSVLFVTRLGPGGGIILDKKTQPITWNDLGTKNYSRYYAIFSKTNPNNYKAFYCLEDWNTKVLYSVSRYILK